MKKLKLYPKTFFYTLGLLLFIVFITHLTFFYNPIIQVSHKKVNREEDLMLTNMNYLYIIGL